MRFEIHRAIAIPYKTIVAFSAVISMLSLRKSSSFPSGPSSVGIAGLAGLGSFVYGVILLTLTVLAFSLFKMIQSINHPISVLAAALSIIFGLFLFDFDLLLYNPFSKRDGELLYLIPDWLVVYSLIIGLVSLGAYRLFYSIKDFIRSYRE